jgi:hypothetical protein
MFSNQWQFTTDTILGVPDASMMDAHPRSRVGHLAAPEPRGFAPCEIADPPEEGVASVLRVGFQLFMHSNDRHNSEHTQPYRIRVPGP